MGSPSTSGVLVAGTYESTAITIASTTLATGTTGKNTFVCKLDSSNGSEKWAVKGGDSNMESNTKHLTGNILAASTAAYVTRNFKGDTKLAGTTITAGGQAGMFVAKLGLSDGA